MKKLSKEQKEFLEFLAESWERNQFYWQEEMQREYAYRFHCSVDVAHLEIANLVDRVVGRNGS